MTQDSQSGMNRAGGARTDSNVLSIVSFVLSAISLFLFPIFFGIAAVIAAAIGLARKERLAKIALIIAVVATIIGIVLGMLVFNATT
ncbi:hypothetical protein [Georgenia sp. MJ170]|uniref:hypothetical protein n=1 Tax=Georgenia sunbinii TaxID=3117728 RepID=UPI002F2687CF